MSIASYDLSTEDYADLAEFADSIDGNIGVTSEGRIVVYGVDAADLVARQPFDKFFLSKVDEETVAFQF